MKSAIMENVSFTPWVGKFYSEKGYNNKKILLLGESHYCGDCREPKGKCDITKNVIKDYLNYKNGNGQFANWMNTFTRFTNIFFEKRCDKEVINDFWNSVIFYNYVQKSTEGPRIPPTEQMFKDSEEAFFEIIHEYNPDVIIVWGERLWNRLPDNGYWGEEYILDKDGGKFYYYKNKTKDIPAYWIYHPSTSYFNYKDSKYLKEIMKLI